jgi:hypothetical protein
MTINSSTRGSFRVTGTFVVGGQTYTVSDNVTIDGRTLTITQQFQRSACSYQYSGTLMKQ